MRRRGMRFIVRIGAGALLLIAIASQGLAQDPAVAIEVQIGGKRDCLPGLICGPVRGLQKGSGGFVGKAAGGGWLVITNAHVVRSEKGLIARIGVWTKGAWKEARLLARDD